MDAVSFWDMTYMEIQAEIRGFQKRQTTELQAKSIVAFRQADLIAELVGILFGSKHQPPTLHDAFPGIFPEVEGKPQQQNWQLMKARVEAYAAEKRKRGEINGDNTGRITGPNNV